MEKIEFKLSQPLKMKYGREKVNVQIPDGGTLKRGLEELGREISETFVVKGKIDGPWKNHINLVVNGEPVHRSEINNYVLKDGDTVHILIPFGGG